MLALFLKVLKYIGILGLMPMSDMLNPPYLQSQNAENDEDANIYLVTGNYPFICLKT